MATNDLPPEMQAQLRRRHNDQHQMAWDSERDFDAMGAFLNGVRPGVIVEKARPVLAARVGGFGRAAQYDWVLAGFASRVSRGDAAGAVRFLSPIRTFVVPDDLACAVVRSCIPAAPDDYGGGE